MRSSRRCVSLVPVEEFLGIRSPVELAQGLDLIGHESGNPWLDDALVGQEGDAWLELDHGFLRRSKRERKMTECRGRDEADESVRARFARPPSGERRLLCTTELCEHHALERKAESAEQRLTGLLGGVLRIAGEPKGCQEIAGQALELAEEAQEPRLSVLVARVERAPHELGECLTRARVLVDPEPVLGERDERLVHDSKVGRRAL